MKPEFKDPQSAFNQAIKDGRLSENKDDSNYAGYYMYMGTWNNKDTFKHIDTREYIK